MTPVRLIFLACSLDLRHRQGNRLRKKVVIRSRNKDVRTRFGLATLYLTAHARPRD